MSGTSDAELSKRLSDHPFFKGMSPEFIKLASEKGVVRKCGKGDHLFLQGEPADKFYLVVDGKVSLETMSRDQERLEIKTVHSGEVLGWSWMVSPFKWVFHARASEPSTVIALDANVLRKLCKSRPADGYEFMLRLLPVVGMRVEYTRLKLLQVYGD
jgi:CRP-like cAMP-binding protein